MRTRRPWIALVPVVVGIAAAGVSQVLWPGVQVRLTTTWPAIFLVVGATASLALGAWALARRRRDRALAQVRGEVEQRAAMEHRRFLDRLDHEMKNPLTAIRAALAAHGSQASPHLSAADAQAVRLSTLIDALRQLGQLQERPLEREAVDLSELVTDAVADVQARLAVNGSTRSLRVDFPTVPWPVPRVWGDPDLLYLAIFNVLSNAAKFTSEGDTVVIRASDDGLRVSVEIGDTGRGIPETELSLVWDELGRATNARDVAGSGLGLPLVRTIVDRHGGETVLRSRPGEGTLVRISLPAVHAKAI